MLIGRAWARKRFCHVKKKKTLDLQTFSLIDKTMKKLHWIPNNIVNTCDILMVTYFDDVKTDLFTHELRNI